MSRWSIGDLATRTGMSTDALRYYEKIGLLPRALRDGGGRRRYGDADLARLLFIQRAQTMNFSLAEIGHLLHLRERPQQARADVRRVAGEKLAQVETRLKSLRLLRNELRLLVNLCADSSQGCPILQSLDGTGVPEASPGTSRDPTDADGANPR
ncbi:MAG: MerR family transcriptional regulator [Pseudomonadota bacterium]|nr:MerR family transcriptional regulator [Pseudomonadota bacterium]